MIRPSVALISLLGGLCAGLYWQLTECRQALAQERLQAAQAKEKATRDALSAVQAVQQHYEKQLRARNRRLERVNSAYAEAMRLMQEGEKRDPQYRHWAKQPLPDSVAKRLQQLAAER